MPNGVSVTIKISEHVKSRQSYFADVVLAGLHDAGEKYDEDVLLISDLKHRTGKIFYIFTHTYASLTPDKKSALHGTLSCDA